MRTDVDRSAPVPNADHASLSAASRRRSPLRTALLVGALLAYVLVIGALTLTPAPWADGRGDQFTGGVLNPAAWLSPRTWTTGSPIEFALNMLLFVPVGMLLAPFGTGRAFVVAAAMTVAVEIAQLPVTGRISDPRDLVANVSGALLGVLFVAVLRRRRIAPIEEAPAPPGPPDAAPNVASRSSARPRRPTR